MDTAKPIVTRLSLDESDVNTMKQILDTAGVSQAWLMSKIVSEGLRALSTQGSTIVLPIRFKLDNRQKAQAA